MIIEGIDTGDLAILITLVTIMLGIVSIILVLFWQTSRSDARIDALRAELSQRVSDVELAQARQDGVNSVLQNQTHTHETLAD